ncbi:MAG: HAD-IA family hydrolase [Aliiglaciecola sp.]
MPGSLIADNKTTIKGVIFDLDGTLMHSSLDFTFLRNQTGCPENRDILDYVSGLSPRHKDHAKQIIIDHELEDARSSSWIDGAKEFVEVLATKGIPMAIVTRNCRQAAQLKLACEQSLIDILLTREDAPPKPDPTALLHIAKVWELDVKELIYVGDYLYDVQAANKAGMRSFLYAPSRNPDYAHQADIVFEHFDILHSHF